MAAVRLDSPELSFHGLLDGTGNALYACGWFSSAGNYVAKLTGTGWVRPLYFSILISHTILAVTIVPLAILSVTNGLKMRVPQHRRVAKWTFPLWMYVSVTGVLVYFFLYHWYPPTA